MHYFEYGQLEIEYLKRRDEKLGKVIDNIGIIKRKVTPDIFTALIESVLSQQISAQAAQTVSGRMHILLEDKITARSIANAGHEAIKNCGISNRKATYILGIAEAVLNGTIDFNTMNTLTDEEIINKLTMLNGVGVWTAEMLLIFSLCRPNIVSYGDLAIRRSMIRLYGLKKLSKEKFQIYKKRYSPYGSVASLYLWALAATCE